MNKLLKCNYTTFGEYICSNKNINENFEVVFNINDSGKSEISSQKAHQKFKDLMKKDDSILYDDNFNIINKIDKNKTILRTNKETPKPIKYLQPTPTPKEISKIKLPEINLKSHIILILRNLIQKKSSTQNIDDTRRYDPNSPFFKGCFPGFYFEKRNIDGIEINFCIPYEKEQTQLTPTPTPQQQLTPTPTPTPQKQQIPTPTPQQQQKKPKKSIILDKKGKIKFKDYDQTEITKHFDVDQLGDEFYRYNILYLYDIDFNLDIYSLKIDLSNSIPSSDYKYKLFQKFSSDESPVKSKDELKQYLINEADYYGIDITEYLENYKKYDDEDYRNDHYLIFTENVSTNPLEKEYIKYYNNNDNILEEGKWYY